MKFEIRSMKFWIRGFEFVPRDLWIGLYWTLVPSFGSSGIRAYAFYVCVVPCFPFVFTIEMRS